MRRTRPKNIEEGHRKLKRDAVRGAVVHALVQGLSALALLWLRTWTQAGWLDGLLLVLAAVDLVTIPPAFIVLKHRLKEIEGGELDAARKY